MDIASAYRKCIIRICIVRIYIIRTLPSRTSRDVAFMAFLKYISILSDCNPFVRFFVCLFIMRCLIVRWPSAVVAAAWQIGRR